MRQAGKILLLGLFVFLAVRLIDKPKTDDYPRIRVIAAGDSASDQAEKYRVVEVLLKIINENGFHEQLDELSVQNRIKAQIAQNAALTHEINISYQTIAYPAKTLNGKFIPGGNYETLVVELGEAEGKNWWSILYPEYYGLSYEDRLSFEEIELKSYVYEKWIKRKNK